MISRPLFISVAESMVTFGPIDQFGCRSACSRVAARIASMRPRAERTAGCGENDAPHILAPPGAERLENRVVLGIDRQHGRAGRGGTAHEQRAGADQAFLVGERDDCAALGRSERRPQSGGTGDRARSPSRPVAAPPRPRHPRRPPPRCRSPRAPSFKLAIAGRIGDRGKARAEFAREHAPSAPALRAAVTASTRIAAGMALERDRSCWRRSSRLRRGWSPMRGAARQAEIEAGRAEPTHRITTPAARAPARRARRGRRR